MKFDLISGKRVLSCVLLSLVSVSTGCKTTSSWMPSSNMFSWDREPDPSLLASEEGYPESPASKYEPSTVASMNAQQGTTGTLAAQTSPYGQSASTSQMPQAGLAARANGYQTGPYQTGPSSPYGQTPVAGTSPMQQSPYGGAYSGGTAAPQSSLASAQGYAPPTGFNPPAGYTAPAGYNTPGAAQAGPGLPAMPVSGQTGLPTSGGSNSLSPTGLPGMQPGGLPSSSGIGITPGPSSSLPSSGSAPFGAGQLPPGVGPTGMAIPPASSAPSAYRGSTALGGFSPGTTGRSTGYDFGAGPTSGGATGTSSTTLPPNTANTSNPLLR